MDFSQTYNILYTDLANWTRAAIRFIPKVAVAILLLLVFTFLSRWISRWVSRGVDRFSNNQSLINLTGAVARVAVMAIGLFVALGVLGLDKALTSLLAGAGVIALAVGFAFQDLTTNFISGTMIALARPIQVGDVVETNGFTGEVLDVKLRSIVLNNGQGQTVEIPSKDVFQKPITNFSRIGLRRIELTAGVSYLDDLAKAQQVAQQAVRQLPFVLPERPVDLHYRNFGDNTIQFMLWFWINPARTSAPAALSEAIKAVKQAFDQQDILIVFAGHTFDLKQKLASQHEAEADRIISVLQPEKEK
ncbi:MULTISPECIES: mechanosensitive ion channel family protein [Spirosoma]|uniref:Mechanosensitive ion channel family protein n=2 Tax=Spirosoma sordidisoli TaxID=2502893 RepID=A0A4V1RWK2_9BACT|nr:MULTISPECIES: mechanosensitive ion channel family protein [Spirosoma]RYC70558.1 mechanosensitive ion channel family protein [Spirosoma sordidisoli]